MHLLIYFTDLIELVPNLVWFRPSPKHPFTSSNHENIPDQNDNFLKDLHDLFPSRNIPLNNHNSKFRDKSVKTLKKYLTHQHDIVHTIIVEESPSIIWTTVVVTIIHLLFDFFR